MDKTEVMWLFLQSVCESWEIHAQTIHVKNICIATIEESWLPVSKKNFRTIFLVFPYL